MRVCVCKRQAAVCAESDWSDQTLKRPYLVSPVGGVLQTQGFCLTQPHFSSWCQKPLSSFDPGSTVRCATRRSVEGETETARACRWDALVPRALSCLGVGSRLPSKARVIAHPEL
eukprot:1248220-Prymnesium_polylepis.2